MTRVGFMGILAFVAGLTVGVTQYATAHTHETYDPLTGVTRTMEYDSDCCNKRDCGPVVDIHRGIDEKKREGWWMTNRLVSGTRLKAFVPSEMLDEPHKWMLNHRNSKVRESQDGRWHICIQPSVPKYPGTTTKSRNFPYGFSQGGGERPTLPSDTTRSIYCVYVPPHMFQGGTKKSKVNQDTGGDIHGWE